MSALVCIANGSVPITHRTSADSDAFPPTCYWVFGIGASRKSSTIGPAIPANSMTRAFPGEKAQLKRLGTLRTNGCRQWNGGFAVRAFFTLLVGEAPFY